MTSATKLLFLVMILTTLQVIEGKSKVVFLDTGNTCRSPTLMYLAKRLQKDESWFSNVEFDSAAYSNAAPVTSGDATNKNKGLSKGAYDSLLRAGFKSTDFPNRQPKTANAQNFPDAANTHFYIICKTEKAEFCQYKVEDTLKLLGDEKGATYKHVNVFGVLKDPVDGTKQATYPAMFMRATKFFEKFLTDKNEWDLTDNKLGECQSKSGTPEWATEWTGGGKTSYELDLRKFTARYEDLINPKYKGVKCSRKSGTTTDSECKKGCKCGNVSSKCRARAFRTCPGKGNSNVHDSGIYRELMPDGAFNSAHMEDYGERLENEEMEEITGLLRRKKGRHSRYYHN